MTRTTSLPLFLVPVREMDASKAPIERRRVVSGKNKKIILCTKIEEDRYIAIPMPSYYTAATYDPLDVLSETSDQSDDTLVRLANVLNGR